MDLVALAAHSRGYSCSLRSFFWQAWLLVAFSPTGLCAERGNHEYPDIHVPCGHFSGERGTWWRFHLHPGTRVPCGHFSGGRGTWWHFHLLVYAAKEDTMNIREAAKFKTDEEGLFILRGFAHDAESVLATIHRLALVRIELCRKTIALELRIAQFTYADGRGALAGYLSMKNGVAAANRRSRNFAPSVRLLRTNE
jgi:hypothetical protein